MASMDRRAVKHSTHVTHFECVPLNVTGSFPGSTRWPSSSPDGFISGDREGHTTLPRQPVQEETVDPTVGEARREVRCPDTLVSLSGRWCGCSASFIKEISTPRIRTSVRLTQSISSTLIKLILIDVNIYDRSIKFNISSWNHRMIHEVFPPTSDRSNLAVTLLCSAENEMFNTFTSSFTQP
ncbi:Uncharacterised protein at_DN2330 [Pycnogonum litorale]